MNRPKTIEDALSLVPEYIMLRPGVDVLMRGDRFPGGCADEGRMVWHEIMPETIGVTVPHGSQIWARPIPEAVRHAEAWWMYAFTFDSNKTRAIPALIEAWAKFRFWEPQSVLDYSLTKDEQLALGGCDKIIAMLRRPQPLSTWLLEGK